MNKKYEFLIHIVAQSIIYTVLAFMIWFSGLKAAFHAKSLVLCLVLLVLANICWALQAFRETMKA